MKTKVLSNILNFVTKSGIVNDDFNESTSIFGESDIEILSRPKIGIGYRSLPKGTIWDGISGKMKFDDISIHLLKNFSNTIDREDYISASVMKKDLIDRWYIKEDDLIEIGRKYLNSLIRGLEKSKLLSYLYENSVELESIWVSEKLNKLDYIIDELDTIFINIANHPSDNIIKDAMEIIYDEEVDHPIIIIEEMINFFKLLIINDDE